jgi:flagellar hook-basal body complex protein FliE
MPLDKIIDPNIAANAYATSQNMSKLSPKGDSADDESFSDFLKGSLEKSVESMKGGEEMAAKAITGDADLTDVVQAVTQAELSLQTVVSLRDRMISVYQDIMRMPI